MGKLADLIKEQGVEISAEVENKVLAAYVEKQEVEAKDAEIALMTKQIADRDKDIEEIKKGGTPAALKAKIEEMQQKHEADKAAHEKAMNAIKLEAAIKMAATKAGAKDADVLEKLIDAGKVKLAPDGKIEGFDEQIENLKTEKAFLFENESGGSGAKYQYKPEGGENTKGSAGTLRDAVADALSASK